MMLQKMRQFDRVSDLMEYWYDVLTAKGIDGGKRFPRLSRLVKGRCDCWYS